MGSLQPAKLLLYRPGYFLCLPKTGLFGLDFRCRFQCFIVRFP